MLTFKTFLLIINEDANLDKMVMDIQIQISQLDNQINTRTQQLAIQKQNLQKRLAPLLKKKEAEDQRNGKEQQVNGAQQQNQQAAAPGSNTTTTPGSSGNPTPGSGSTTFPLR